MAQLMLLLLALGACAAPPPRTDKIDTSPPPPEPWRAAELDRPVLVPRELTASREYFVRAAADAEKAVQAFCRERGWAKKKCEAKHFRSIEVFSSQQALWQRILLVNKMPDQPMPTKGLAAGLEKGVLMAVSPAVYREVAPEFANASEVAWSRLLAHEIVHRLHVDLVNGEEDAMGPTWFFEGFAVLGSGQEVLDDLPKKREIEGLIEWAKEKKAYSRYGALVKALTERIPLKDLVANAGREEFEDWLAEKFDASHRRPLIIKKPK